MASGQDPRDAVPLMHHAPSATALHDHLARWGLKRFTSDKHYFEWQRQCLSPSELTDLHHLIERKRNGSSADEMAFYDATASSRVLPVLYSQRYEYYVEVGSRITARIDPARTVLDFGCGAGILTTYYASQYPDRTFIGLDRSRGSIERARAQAATLGLKNVRFEWLDVLQEEVPGTFDLIISTHALVQAEQDPGIPSRSWETFERNHNEYQQRGFETRTGIGLGLDRLTEALAPQGRMVVFEKTRQLARRVPFQRALASRGLSLIERPEPIRYQQVEEVSDDGPFYVLEKNGRRSFEWDEAPEPDEAEPFDPSVITIRPSRADEPWYENHHPSAQRVWEGLHGRVVLTETTRAEPDGRQMHVELGQALEGRYLYCANTFDQRQLIIVDPVRSAMIESYYREIIDGTSQSGRSRSSAG
ncbi:class I SAM-dependent methyltransferase [Petrachloros mirabilis]